MKKFLLYSLLALAVTVCGFYAVLRQKASLTHAPGLVGEETLIFLHCPDIPQSRIRWEKTALHQIANEPEIRAFLEKPKAQVPKSGEVISRLNDFWMADPREAFFALQSASKPPAFVAGALCLGDKTKIDSLLTELKTELLSQWPDGKKEESLHSGVTIQTLSYGKSTLATAWVGRWILLADNLELIQQTIDRALRTSKQGLLKDSPDFQKSLAHLPAHPELLTYLRPQELAQALAHLKEKAGLPDPAVEDFKQVKSLGMCLKFEGENIRDALFALSDHPVQQSVLERQSLQFTTSDTLLYFAGLMDLTQAAEKMAKLAQKTSGTSLALAALSAGLASQGVSLSTLASILGNEYGVLLDWPATSAHPSLLASADLKDRALAMKTLEQFVSSDVGNAWEQTQEGGVDFFTLSLPSIVTPSLAITEKNLIIGSDIARVKAGLVQQTSQGGLSATSGYQGAEKALKKPTQAFGYIDTRSLFERVYGTCRPLLMLWGGFNPTVRNSVDLTKLPSTEAISKHLTPIAYSSSYLPEGYLAESVGPITFNQTIAVAGIGIGAAVLPMAKSYFTGAPHLLPMPQPSLSGTSSPLPAPTP